MKLVIKKRSHKIILILGYVFLPLLLWFMIDIYGVVFGFFLAYIFDRFYPRTMTSLNWDEVALGISNFLDNSVLGAKFYIIIGKRRIFFLRSEIRQQAMLTLQFSRREWSGVIDEKTEDFFLKKRVSASLPERLWRFRMYVTMYLAPERDPIQKAVALIKDISELAGIEVDALHFRAVYCHLTTRELFQKVE